MVTELLMRWQAVGPSDAGFATGAAPSAGRRVTCARSFLARDHAPSWLIWVETEGEAASDPAPAFAGGLSLELVRDVGVVKDAVTWQYLVHTDIPDTIVDEYNAWYDNEHLPRLVGVPGIFRARRFVALTGQPRYLTAYDIAEPGVWESPAALTARKTPWTAKMRGLFQNTDRAFCEFQATPQG